MRDRHKSQLTTYSELLFLAVGRSASPLFFLQSPAPLRKVQGKSKTIDASVQNTSLVEIERISKLINKLKIIQKMVIGDLEEKYLTGLLFLLLLG